jgi:hypothetical protein
MTRQSSSRLSSLASKIQKLKSRPGLAGATIEREGRYVPVEDYNELLHDAQSLAGSVMTQDEIPTRKR